MRSLRGITTLLTLSTLPLIVAAPTSAAPPDASCRTIEVNAAPVLNAEDLHVDYGVDGSGVKIGIISDSFDVNTPNDSTNPDMPAISSAAENIADGLLPGPGNPCGYEQPVRVLKELPTGPGIDPGTDEGRAMAQVVHGLAPGAELLFASAADQTQSSMIAAIDLLVDSDVDIIVDDVVLVATPDGADEPMFQQSLLSAEIQELVETRGVVYVSAAGNESEPASRPLPGQTQTPIGSWQSAAYRPAACEPDVAAAISADYPAATFDCMDFDPTTAVDSVSTIETFPARLYSAADATSITAEFSFQWGQGTADAQPSFGMVVTTNTAAPTVAIPEAAHRTTMLIDVPFTLPSLNDGTVVEMSISIFRFISGPHATSLTPPIGWLSVNVGSPDWLASSEHWRSQGPDLVGASIVGHNGAPGVISVGAGYIDAGGSVEPYSSVGPSRYFLTPENEAGTAAPLAAPEIVGAPTLLGVDGEGQNVLASVEIAPGVYAFRGASAAAPSVAALAALALQLDPTLNPREVRDALTATAVTQASPFATVPAEDVVGAGLADARALLTAIATDLRPSPAPSPSTLPATGMDGGATRLVAVTGAIAFLALALVTLILWRRGARET